MLSWCPEPEGRFSKQLRRYPYWEGNNCSQSSAYEVLNGDGRKRIAVANYVLTLEENPLSGLTPDLISFSFILASLCSRARFTRDSMWSASKGFAM